MTNKSKKSHEKRKSDEGGEVDGLTVEQSTVLHVRVVDGPVPQEETSRHNKEDIHNTPYEIASWRQVLGRHNKEQEATNDIEHQHASNSQPQAEQIKHRFLIAHPDFRTDIV
ncbi:hypothetical protein AYI68_g5571, partial [Smittium mucronatum]